MSLNIEKDPNFETNKIINIKVDNKGSYLGYDDNGLNFSDSGAKPQWKLNLVENNGDVNNLLGTTGFVDNTGVSYPPKRSMQEIWD